MKDKTKLAMVGTIVALAVVVLIGLIYFVVARKRFVLSAFSNSILKTIIEPK